MALKEKTQLLDELILFKETEKLLGTCMDNLIEKIGPELDLWYRINIAKQKKQNTKPYLLDIVAILQTQYQTCIQIAGKLHKETNHLEILEEQGIQIEEFSLANKTLVSILTPFAHQCSSMLQGMQATTEEGKRWFSAVRTITIKFTKTGASIGHEKGKDDAQTRRIKSLENVKAALQQILQIRKRLMQAMSKQISLKAAA